ncbi:MAG: penicillin-binding transpeptidase domain-containing protein, partial [Anaerolineae bacterium]
ATTALRQPGSSIKPITYAAAFSEGRMTPATVMMDVRTAFVTREGTPYVPLNYDLTYRGPVRLREALASSYNVVAVKVLDAIGIKTMTDLARRMGITTLDASKRLGLAVTLGGGEVRLLDLTTAFAAFANGGFAVTPQVVRSVSDVNGTVVWEQSCDSPVTCLRDRAMDERVAYLISDILSDDRARISTFGEGSVLALTRPTAVKTGTTTDFRDNWTVGYTPSLVVAAWIGNADNEAMNGVTGITGAAPLWRDVMEVAHRGLPVRGFTRPNGLVEAEVCALSGRLPGPDCPHHMTETFVVGTEPTTACEMHVRLGDQVYIALPPEAQAWGRNSGVPMLPVDAGTSKPGATLVLLSPNNGAVYHIDPVTPLSQQKIRIAAATDLDLAHATLLVDGLPYAEFTTAPYEALWQLLPGTHRFQMRGVDQTGAMIESTFVEIRVESDP